MVVVLIFFLNAVLKSKIISFGEIQPMRETRYTSGMNIVNQTFFIQIYRAVRTPLGESLFQENIRAALMPIPYSQDLVITA